MDCNYYYSIATTDIDECDTDADECDNTNGKCINTIGSFTCSCSQGYSGDGFICIGKQAILGLCMIT